MTEPHEKRRRFVIVHNATAGRRGRKLVPRVVDALLRRGALVTLRDTASIADAQSVCLQAGAVADAVIAAGGDGTIRALAKTIGPSVPIGIIPVGTGNVMANEIGLPRAADAIARTLCDGPVVEVEGALANGEPFFLMAGAGFDGAVVRALNMTVKQRVGRTAYVAPALREVLQAGLDLSVAIDGTRLGNFAWAILTRVRHYGGTFTLTRRAGLLTPGVVAVLFRPQSKAQFIRQLLSLAAGRLDRATGVEIWPGRRFEINSRNVVWTQLDGDALGTTPLIVEAGGPKMRLIVPRDCIAAAGAGSALVR